MSLLLKASPVFQHLKQALKAKVDTFFLQHQRKPGLAVVLIGDDPASVIYTTKKKKLAEELGFLSLEKVFPKEVTPSLVKQFIHSLNDNPTIDGILIQRPLPPAFIDHDVISWIHPKKDVDCFHPQNVGNQSLGLGHIRSCTPQGILKLLHHYQISCQGKHAVVIGRSRIVGRPLFDLLNHENATVTLCHKGTNNLKTIAKQADLLFVAAGVPKLITRDYTHPDQIIIDVGIHRLQDKICGDVDFEAVAPHVHAITPVPGGVGPMTLITLLENTLTSAVLK